MPYVLQPNELNPLNISLPMPFEEPRIIETLFFKLNILL